MDGAAAAQVNDLALEAIPAEQPESAGADSAEPEGDGWRNEVASRLERYRARRKPRAPRYPSLRLPFEQSDWQPASGSALAVSASVEPESSDAISIPLGAPHLVQFAVAPVQETEFSNVIEFPRYAAVPVHHRNELAEPIFERPRIVEAPEVLPPPPAMGGILMEPSLVREPDRRTDAELELQPASLPQRMAAGIFDFAILLGAMAGFSGIFVWLNPQRPPLAIMVAAAAMVAPILWAAYEFLFTVYTSATPGLEISHLRLVRFDGSQPSRSLRRWRVLASYLSAMALGLGYLWSVLDEDRLCWHDRITHTHLSPVPHP